MSDMSWIERDITWCNSPDCADKCDRHISKCKAQVGDLISIADFSTVCPDYMRVVLNIFDEVEVHDNCTVQILRNSATGEESVGWWDNDET